MNNLTIFDYEGQEIRTTPDRQFSVFDVLVAFKVCDKSHGQRTLKRIEVEHSEVRHFWVNFKFPGRGQRETPVATEEDIYQILMLCPGKRGAEFRKWAAGIIADPEKAASHAIAKWKNQGKSDAWINKRLAGKVKRYEFTDTLKQHDISKPYEYAQCTNSIYLPVLGGEAKVLKEQRGTRTLRDAMTDVELMAVGLAEAIAAERMEKEQIHGFAKCREVCREAGDRVRRVFE